MAGELGKATLELDVTGFATFEGKMQDAHASADRLDDKLKGLAAVADVTGHMLGNVEISPGQAARSAGSVASILEGVHGLSDEARTAARQLDDVHLGETQAAESRAAGDQISENLDKIDRKANAARHSLDRVRLAGGRTGVGVGPIGSGFGRVGLLGTAIGVGAVTAPAAAPALGGLLATIPTLGAAAIGVIGTLVLALHGMGAAIDGDYKAYKKLQPEQQQFVMTIRSLIPWVDKLKETAAQGLVPGLTAGLKEALSPGTVSLIQSSVGLISSTLGQAATTWGAFFGSSEFQSIFGPLMVSGARNLGVMAVAALHLFDALGVVLRSAIPLTNWMTDAVGRGAALADEWIHAKDASGELGAAMGEARTSLQAVGGLLTAAARAVGALGVALYPVSKVAVKDLTDGLNALAGIIHRNEAAIRDIVGAVLTGLVDTVKIAAAGVRGLVDAFAAIVGRKDAVIAAVGAIAAAVVTAMVLISDSTPWGAIITGAFLAVGLIVQNWGKVKTFFADFGQFMLNVFEAAWTGIKGIFNLGVYGLLVSLEGLTKGLESSLGWIPKLGPKIRGALQQVDGFIEQFRERGVAELGQAGVEGGNAWAAGFTNAASSQLNDFLKKSAALKTPGAEQYGPPNPNAPSSSTTKKVNEPAPGTHAWYIKYLGYDPTAASSSVFGTPPPFTKNVPAAAAEKSLEVPLNLQLRQAAADASGIEARQRAAAAAIKSWAERMIASSTLTTKQHIQALQLITQENSILATKDKAAQLEVPLRLQLQQAKADASGLESKQRAAARAIKNWAQSMIRSSKLTTQELISAYDLIAQENSILANKVNSVSPGANEAQFLQSFQTIMGSFGSNADQGPQKVDIGAAATHLYESVHELRNQTEHLKRIAGAGEFAEIARQHAAAEAVLG